MSETQWSKFAKIVTKFSFVSEKFFRNVVLVVTRF